MSAKSLKRSQAMAAAASQAEPEDVRVVCPPFGELLRALGLALFCLLIAAICALPSYVFIADMFTKRAIRFKDIFLVFSSLALFLFFLATSLAWLAMLGSTLHKRFFVQANQQGVEFYSTPLIPWSAIQRIQANFKDSCRFHGERPSSHIDTTRYYSIILQIEASWFQEHLQNARLAKFLSRIRRRKEHSTHTLIIPFDFLGANSLITIEQIKALHRHHNKRLRRWSPKLVRLLQAYTDEPPEGWLNKRLEEEKAKLAEYANQRPWDSGAEYSLFHQLKRIDDLFSEHGGDAAEELEISRAYLLCKKEFNEYKHLEAIENRNSLQEIRFRRLQKEFGDA